MNAAGNSFNPKRINSLNDSKVVLVTKKEKSDSCSKKKVPQIFVRDPA